jgi:hypothetical protein
MTMKENDSNSHVARQMDEKMNHVCSNQSDGMPIADSYLSK